MPKKRKKPLFHCGQLCATAGALKAVPPMELTLLMKRHLSGDWGDISENDAAANEDALHYGDRIISWYTASTNDRIMVITEADRSATTILLADEY